MYITGTTYKIFISSTFKDMDFERDVVRNLVIPQLNHTYSKYNIEFQAVDLRYGINTRGISEKEASQKVLNMCINAIEASEPFFISFVGNRYGWVPDKKEWEDFYNQLDDNQKDILKKSDDISVTEMEILFAEVFSKKHNADFNCLFFIRSEESLQTLSEDAYNDFIETDERQKQKLKVLKDKITELCKSPNNSSHPYSVDYKDFKKSKNDVAKMVIKAITPCIEKVLEKHSFQKIENTFKDWEREASKIVGYFTKLYKQSLYREGEEHLDEGNILILGNEFSGKSTYLARHYIKLYNEDWQTPDGEPRKILLCVRVNTSKYSRSMRHIMGRWVIELANIINLTLEEDLVKALTNPSKESEETIISMFYTEVDIIRSAGHSVHIFMDDIHLFAISSPGDELLQWVDERVIIYASASNTSQTFSETLLRELPFTVLAPSDVIIDDNKDFIRKVETSNVCELPANIKTGIAQYKANLLNINLLFVAIKLLNQADFSIARSSLDYAEKIEKTLIDFFASTPANYNEALDYLIDFYSSKTYSGKVCRELFNLLKHSPIGLREVDIFELVSEELTTLELYQIIDFFKHFVKHEKETGILSLRHPSDRITSYITYNKIYEHVHDLPDGNEFYQAFELSEIDDSYVPSPDELEEHFAKAKTSINRYKYNEALSIIDWLLKKETIGPPIDANDLLITKMHILAYKDSLDESAYILDVILKKIAGQRNIYTELEASIYAYRNDDMKEAISCGILMKECIESIFKTQPFCKYIYYSYLADILFFSRNFEASLEYRKMAIDMLKSMHFGIEACYAYSYIKHALACYYIKIFDGFHAYDHVDELNYAIEADQIIRHRNLDGSIVGQLYIMMADIYCYEHNDLESALEYYEMAYSRIPSDNEASKIIREKIIDITTRLNKA